MHRIATLLVVASIPFVTIAPAAAQTPPAATPASPAPQAVLVGSDSLVGSAVRDAEGRDIGKVSRLMIDPADGKITSVVIATGGTLGVGGNTISVPWTGVKVGQEKGKVIVTASQTLESAPRNAPAEPRRQ